MWQHPMRGALATMAGCGHACDTGCAPVTTWCLYPVASCGHRAPALAPSLLPSEVGTEQMCMEQGMCMEKVSTKQMCMEQMCMEQMCMEEEMCMVQMCMVQMCTEQVWTKQTCMEAAVDGAGDVHGLAGAGTGDMHELGRRRSGWCQHHEPHSQTSAQTGMGLRRAPCPWTPWDKHCCSCSEHNRTGWQWLFAGFNEDGLGVVTS